jgi:hypothetical protein
MQQALHHVMPFLGGHDSSVEVLLELLEEELGTIFAHRIVACCHVQGRRDYKKNGRHLAATRKWAELDLAARDVILSRRQTNKDSTQILFAVPFFFASQKVPAYRLSHGSFLTQF